MFLLGFTALFINLQEQAEEEARNALRARNTTNLIAQLQADIITMVLFANTTESYNFDSQGYKGFLRPPFIKTLEKMRREYSELETLTTDRPELNAAVKRSKDTASQILEALREITAAIKVGDKDKVLEEIHKSNRLGNLEKDWYLHELALVAKLEEECADKSIEKQAELRRRQLKYVIILIVAEGIFSVLMALFLVRTITARLDLMRDNQLRLAAGKPLLPAMTGGDEIASLDHVFHDMARTIDEAAQAKQNLFNMVTHDIRSPLSSIQGCLDILERSAEEDSGQGGANAEMDERSRRLLKVAIRNSNRTMGLITDLLNSQKIQSGMYTLEAEEVHLAEVFEEIRLSLADLMSEYGLDLKIKHTDLLVLAKRDLLGRILYNLLTNAIKYSPKGASIYLEAEGKGRMAEISVTDQGPGIPANLQDSIFQPFKQVEPATAERRGSGLGLAICHDFVALHGGEIWVESKPGNGSSFRFTMPLA